MQGTKLKDAGAATAETAVAMPLLLMLILLIVQFGVWAHAMHVAHTTAEQGLSATRAEGATVANGRQQAENVRQQIGRHTLADATIAVSRGSVEARVSITGAAPRVLPVPFLRLPVRAEAVGPVERFRPDPRAARRPNDP